MKRTRDAEQHASDQTAAQPGSKRHKHTHKDASTASRTLQQGRQQKRAETAQKLAGEDAAAAATDATGATAATKTESRCNQQPLDAAEAAHAAPLTVGDVCSSSGSSRQLEAALRKWAALHQPAGHLTPHSDLDATPVVDLLPHLGRFLQYCKEQVAAGGKLAAAAQAQADQLLDWLLQQKQLLHAAARHLQQQAYAAPACEQQGNQGTAQQQAEGGSAAAAPDVSEAADTSATGTEPQDKPEPAAALEQQPRAAGPGARTVGTLTVGKVCNGRKVFLTRIMQAWAKFSFPNVTEQVLHKVPVVDLLPDLEHYLQHLRERVESQQLKPQTAASMAQHLRIDPAARATAGCRQHQQAPGPAEGML
jgi:hypothetical protein